MEIRRDILAKIIQEINLEVAKPNLFQAVVAKQSDYGSRYLKATFVNNGEKINLDPKLKATINAKRPDGLSKKFESIVNQDGTVTAPLTSWMLEKSGLVTCDISVLTEEGKLTTTDFSIHVNVAACTDGDISQDADYDLLKELIEQVETLDAEIQEKYISGEFKGEKGDKGDPGAINFIVVTELPTENIDESAIYMKPADNPEEENSYGEYIYVNGSWEFLGNTNVEVDLTGYIKNGDSVEIGISTNSAADITTSTDVEEIITAWETDKFSLAQGLGNVVVGYDNLSLGEKGSMAIGRQTRATNSYAFASGLKTQAKGYASRAGGSNTLAEADYSKADGFFSEAIGGHSVADGYSAKAYGACSHVVNRENTAKGDNSFVCGLNNISEGANTFVAGSGSVAQGSGSFVGGTNIQESGNCNAVFNANNVIKGQFSTVLGRRNEIGATTYQGIVTGNSCKLGADGSQSRNTFVGGQSSESVLANDSFIYGNSLKLTKQVWGWAVFGGYNDPGSDATLAVGNGKSDEARSNAFEVYSSGLVKTPNAPDPTDNYHLATKKYVDGKVSSIAIPKQTVTLTSIVEIENNNVNFPVRLDANKKYNIMFQFVTKDATGGANNYTGYFEGVSFTDDQRLIGLKSLHLSEPTALEGNVFSGVHIYLNMFYDFTKVGNDENGPGAKDGWVWVQTEHPSSDYTHTFTLTITEA